MAKKRSKRGITGVKKRSPRRARKECISKKNKEKTDNIIWAGLLSLVAHLFLWFVLLGHPFADSFIISFVISGLTIGMAIEANLFERGKKNIFDASKLIIGVVLALVTLQAAWPIFMPLISMQEVSQESGVFFGDREGVHQYQVIREAVITVKPPLIPLVRAKSYPIAENMRLLGSSSSINLQMDDAGDGRSVKIKLGPATGWSFDEVAGNIRYQADRRFNFFVMGNNITHLVGNRTIVHLNNQDNELPVAVVNLTLLIEKDTPAWEDIKIWIDAGSCVRVYFSDQWDYRDSTSYVMRVNDISRLISRDLMNSSIFFKMYYIFVESWENKDPYIIFERTSCEINI